MTDRQETTENIKTVNFEGIPVCIVCDLCGKTLTIVAEEDNGPPDPVKLHINHRCNG